MKNRSRGGVTLLSAGITLLLMLSQPVSAQGLALSLDEAVRLALRDNPDMQITRLEYDLAQRKKAYEQKEHPGLELSATLTEFRLDADKDGALPAPDWSDLRHPRGQVQLSWNVTPKLTFSSGLSVSTNLSNPSVRVTPSLKISYATDLFQPKAPNLEPVYVAKEQSAVAQAETRLAYDVTEAFFNVLKRRHEAELLTTEQEIAALKLLRARVQEKSEADILRAESDLDDVNERLTEGLEAVYSAEVSMAVLLNLSTVADTDLIFDLPYEPIGNTLSQWLTLGVSNSSAVTDAATKLKDAQERLITLQSDHGWKVSFSASYEAQKWPDGNKPANRSEQEVRASISVRNTLLPVDKFALEEAELAVVKAEVALNSAVSRAERDVETVYRRLETIEERLSTLDTRLVEANEALERELRRVKAGLATELDLMEVRSAIRVIEIDIIHAHYDHFLAKLELLNMCGIGYGEVSAT
jgi:outer membrane protein TolC